MIIKNFCNSLHSNNLLINKIIYIRFSLIYLKDKLKFNLGIDNGDWGLGIGDWGLGPIPNPQSPIPNPQSPCFFYFI